MKSKEEMLDLKRDYNREQNKELIEFQEKMREEAFPKLLKRIVERAERGIIHGESNPTAVTFESLIRDTDIYKRDYLIFSELIDDVKYGENNLKPRHQIAHKIRKEFMAYLNAELEKTGNYSILAEWDRDKVLIVGDKEGFGEFLSRPHLGFMYKPISGYSLPEEKVELNNVEKNDKGSNTEPLTFKNVLYAIIAVISIIKIISFF
ncbi:hypothetical protein [Weissella cibaria]|uniref:hypothetical protein n=1 Tax=Weissella cibaria TaxID=137591 RepID=UPI0013DBF90B|nr:hypothetical protein [Weissella cibaria]NFA01873.1 hypothetical protein [Weissella cibaria]